MESVSTWTECQESGCIRVSREKTCANHTKQVEISWTQAMPCPECDQVFLSPRELKDHLHFVHWGWLVQLCDHCGETFFHSEQLKRHENNSHSSIVEQIIEIPMELKSSEKVETDKESEKTNLDQNENARTSNNTAIDELLSEIGRQGNLANFTRIYIGTVRNHLDFQHQESFTDCLDCFKADPLSVLFAEKASNLQPFHKQDTFDQLWRENAILSKGAVDKEKQLSIETENLNSDMKEDNMDFEESDGEEDEDLADYEEIGFEETDDEMVEINTALGRGGVETNCDNKGIIDEETKETDEDKIDTYKKSLGNMNISHKAPLRRRLYGF